MFIINQIHTYRVVYTYIDTYRVVYTCIGTYIVGIHIHTLAYTYIHFFTHYIYSSHKKFPQKIIVDKINEKWVSKINFFVID